MESHLLRLSGNRMEDLTSFPAASYCLAPWAIRLVSGVAGPRINLHPLSPLDYMPYEVYYADWILTDAMLTLLS